MKKITLMSFGFKYGAPNANYYFDVGFLKNPSREKSWDFFSYPDSEMAKFVLDQPQAKRFIELVLPLLLYLADIDQNQVVAFGCSAGRHRSNILVEELSRLVKQEGVHVITLHRDLS